MIRLVTGSLGSGKTLFCVSEMFADLCDGYHVATNVDIIADELAKLMASSKGRVFDPSRLHRIDLNATPDFHRAIPWGDASGTVRVYLDEIHLFFNSRDWQKTSEVHRQLVKFLSQSRKARVDVTFITQEAENLEGQFRRLAEFEDRIFPSHQLALGAMGSSPVRFFLVCRNNLRSEETLSRRLHWYDRRLFKCYRSFEMLDSDMQQLESEQTRVSRSKLPRTNIFTRTYATIVHPLASRLRLIRLKPTPPSESCVSGS